MWRLLMALLAVTLLAIAAASGPQSSGTADPSKEPAKKKSKKVWTTEDLSKIRGGVSVVGEKEAPREPAEEDPETSEAQEPLPAEARKTKEIEPCVSRSWSAAVDPVVSAQGVGLGRSFWMDRFFGGDLCPAVLPGVPALAKRLDGDHFLDDGTKVKLQAVIFSGRLPPANDIAVMHDRGGSYVLVWKGHPYVTTNIGGVVWVSDEGSREYVLDTIDLYDPYENRRAKFSIKKGHKASEIDAMVEIRITR